MISRTLAVLTVGCLVSWPAAKAEGFKGSKVTVCADNSRVYHYVKTCTVLTSCQGARLEVKRSDVKKQNYAECPECQRVYAQQLAAEKEQKAREKQEKELKKQQKAAEKQQKAVEKQQKAAEKEAKAKEKAAAKAEKAREDAAKAAEKARKAQEKAAKAAEKAQKAQDKA